MKAGTAVQKIFGGGRNSKIKRMLPLLGAGMQKCEKTLKILLPGPLF